MFNPGDTGGPWQITSKLGRYWTELDSFRIFFTVSLAKLPSASRMDVFGLTEVDQSFTGRKERLR
jgi:hypothetical protein